MQPPDDVSAGQSENTHPFYQQDQQQSALSMAGLVARPSVSAAEFVPSSYATSSESVQQQRRRQQQEQQQQQQQQLQKHRLQYPQGHTSVYPSYQNHRGAGMAGPDVLSGGHTNFRQMQRGARFATPNNSVHSVNTGAAASTTSTTGTTSTAAAASQHASVHPGQHPFGAHDVYANYQIRENARMDVTMLLRSAGGTPGVPEVAGQYYNLLPLESAASPLLQDSAQSAAMAMPVMSVLYKAVSSKTGHVVALHRVLGPLPVHSLQLVRAADVWRRVVHPGIVRLLELFTTREFAASTGHAAVATNEVVLAYEFCPRADTLHGVFLSSPHQYHPLGEQTLWAIALQLLAATAAVHGAGLALRDSLSPSHILVTGRNRVKINWAGINDIFDRDGIDHVPIPQHAGSGGSFAANASVPASGVGTNLTTAASAVVANGAKVVALQKEDLLALGRILLVLAARAHSSHVRGGVLLSTPSAALEAVQQSGVYSTEFLHVIAVLIAAASPSSRTTVRDVLTMVGPRLASEMSNVWVHADALDMQFARECDAGRLFRLATLLGFVNERPDSNASHPHWAETGDRYLLKLFRDYVFHRADDDGRPALDFAHVIECLNRLDIASSEKVLLSSRDGESLITASYEDLRRCLMHAVDDLRQHAASTSLPSTT